VTGSAADSAIKLITLGTGTTTGNFAGLPNGQFVTNFDSRNWNIDDKADVCGGLVVAGNSVPLTPVPEPGTLQGLGAVTLAAFGLVRRHQTRRNS
jgi:hypothetical protein